MINQKKCPKCGKWTDGDRTHCVFCDALIDPVLVAKERKRVRDEEARERRLLEETKFEKYLRNLQESDKPIHKIGFKILNTVFTIYMAILSFFIWLIALISG
jgi:uncharacterized membrane protein